MASELVNWLNWMSDMDACALFRGVCQGTLLFAIVWALLKALPRVPSTVRCWIWWLVCAKFLIAAVFVPSITVRILPPHARTAVESISPPLLSRLTGLRPVDHFSAVPRHAGRTRYSGESSDVDSQVAPAPASSSTAATAPLAISRAGKYASVVRLSTTSILFVVWAIGSICLLAMIGARSRRLAKMVQQGCPVNGHICQILEDQCGRTSVRAVLSDTFGGPFVTGLIRPVLVLPKSWAESASTGDLRMAIAHELAHLRRRDLWLDLLPTLSTIVFWFVPFAWIAARLCALAREEACDSSALRSTASNPAAYASMLLNAAAGRPPAGALGVSSAYRQLQTRLVCLAAALQPSTRAARTVSVVLVASLMSALLPWRPAARAERSTRTSTRAMPVRWQLIDLGPISTDDAAHFRINDQGQVIGTSFGRPFLWNNGTVEPLTTLWYQAGRGGAINNRGSYVVTYYSDSGRPHALYAGGRMRWITGLQGYRFTVARAVSDSGWIVGSAQRTGADRAGAEISRAILSIDGKTQDLGTLGGDHSAAYAVNRKGEIVGKADLPMSPGSHPTHAFLWQSGQMHDLGTLGGTHSFAYALNNAGSAAGFSLLPGDLVRHACLWRLGSPAATVDRLDIGALPGDSASEAHGINDSGDIVGTSDLGPDADNNRAVVWHSAGDHVTRPMDLNDLARPGNRWILTDAMAINNAGVIVGNGEYSGEKHAFVLRPLPSK